MLSFIIKRMPTLVTAVCLVVAIALLSAFTLFGGGMPQPAQAATTTPGPAIPGTHFITFNGLGNITSTTQIVNATMPFRCKLVGVTLYAGQAWLADGDETYVVSITGDTAGNLITPITVNTPAADPVAATIVNSTITDEDEIVVTATLGGTTPAWGDYTIGLTCLQY